MQVFLPFFDFRLVALCLDNKRLNKQLVEAYQIITKRLSYTHMRHPAVLLWEPYLGTLADYAAVLCEEYHNRFHKIHKVAEFLASNKFENQNQTCWFLNENSEDGKLILLSHRVNLLRKNYSHYSQFFNVENLNAYPQGYYWAVTANQKLKSAKDSHTWKIFVKNNFLLDKEDNFR